MIEVWYTACMLFIYHGNEMSLVRSKVKQDWPIDTNSDVAVVTLAADDYQSGQLSEAVGGASLFAPTCWYILDTPSAQADFATELTTHLSDLTNSPHQFIVLENTLTAAEKKQYAKHTEHVIDCSVTKPKRVTAFSLVDHLCRRDKRQLWVELHSVLKAGLSPEEIIGTLWWQLKTIRIAACTQSAKEAGIKDYPYKKAKAALRVFSLADVERLSRQLLAVYHDGHGGKRDIRLGLEEWVLRV